MSELLSVAVEDGIAVITLERPKMNALNAQLQDELIVAAREVGTDPEVRAVIVWGGERVFAAGADIKEMEQMSYQDMLVRSHVLQEFTTAIARIPKPTVAAITGYALGGGCELALACDFRVVADDAKLGQPEILLGIIPGAGGTQRLARLVGPAKAKDLVLTGRFVDAQEALAIGLVDEVVAPDQVLQASRERLARYSRGPAHAVAAAKAAIDRGLDVDLATGLEIERQLFAGLFATEDRASGMASFLENGPGKATFEGR